jgi:predicted Zn-dependent protease
VDREGKVAKLADDWKKKTKSTSLKVNRDSYLKMIDGIIYGEDPKQGFVEDNIFYHPVLKFQFPIPQQWTVQNTPEQVQMASKDGKAMLIFTIAQGGSLEAAAEGLLKNYQLSLVESKKTNVNGLPAFAMVADQIPQEQQQQQQPSLRALIYLIQHEKNIYAMIGVSAPKDFMGYVTILRSSMENFKNLSDPSKLNKQPERIRIKTVQQKGTLANALQSYRMNDSRMEEVAILNGMKLTDSVDKGMLIKIIDE